MSMKNGECSELAPIRVVNLEAKNWAVKSSCNGPPLDNHCKAPYRSPTTFSVLSGQPANRALLRLQCLAGT